MIYLVVLRNRKDPATDVIGSFTKYFNQIRLDFILLFLFVQQL